MTSDSKYYKDAKATHDQVMAAYTKFQVSVAKTLVTKGQCKSLKAAISAATRTWKPAATAMKRVGICKTIDPYAGKSGADLVMMMKQAYLSGNYKKVLDISKAAVGKTPQAYKYCGFAACALKKTSKAKQCYSKSGSAKGSVKRFCEGRGISLD